MQKLLALLVLVVRFALHQRRPPGGDPPSGRNRPGDSNPPPPATAVRPAQQTAREKLEAGQPAGSRSGSTDPNDPGDPGDPNDPNDPGAPDDPEGAFTTPQPDGVPKKRDDKWLKRNGVDPHEVKGDLPGPMSHFDLHVDRSGNIWAVRKGADPRSGEYVGNVDDYAD